MTAQHRPIVELRGVSRTYAPDHSVGIRDITLRVFPGEFVAIVGPSGAGKSTLLNVLGLLDQPTDGQYLLDGEDVSQVSDRRADQLRAQHLGFVFQSSHILGDMSALENAALSLRIQNVAIAERTSRAVSALDQLGLAPRWAAHGKVLSGGERQRVAIARAIATKPALILADEPTGNLDSANSALVIEHLRDLNAQGVTIVLITHDRLIAGQATRQIEIIDGRALDVAGSSVARTARGAGGEQVKLSDSVRRPRASMATALLDDVADAISTITRRVARSVLLMLAFALGVAGMVTAVGMSESAAGRVAERLTAAALDEVRVHLPGGASLLDEQDGRLSIWLERASALPHVDSVAFVATASGSSSSARRLAAATEAPSEYFVISTSENYLDLVGSEVGSGAPFALVDHAAIRQAAWIGDQVAAGLNIDSPGPGVALWVDQMRIDVVGIVGGTERAPELARSVIVSADTMRQMAQVGVSLVVRTEPGFPAAVAEALPVALDAGNPGQFTIETVADLRALRFGVANDLGNFVGILAALVLTLAAISASVTMFMSVQARTSEIALRRAVGASRAGVARVFLLEGAFLGLYGGVLGAAVGTGAVVVAAGAQSWAAVLPPHLAPLGVGIGVLAGLVSAVVPAISASRKDPAAAIRT